MDKGLMEEGITLDTAPIADMIYERTDTIFGDRSCGSEPEIAIPLPLALIGLLKEEKVAACIKYILCHGRANVDSNKNYLWSMLL